MFNLVLLADCVFSNNLWNVPKPSVRMWGYTLAVFFSYLTVGPICHLKSSCISEYKTCWSSDYTYEEFFEARKRSPHVFQFVINPLKQNRWTIENRRLDLIAKDHERLVGQKDTD